MDKNYYVQYFTFERKHWWFRARAEILKTYIRHNIFKDQRSGNILNVGAATGGSTEWLSGFGDVRSIEYEQDCINFVKDKIEHRIEHGSILDLSFSDNSFDLVCAFDVIEHVEDDRLAVKELVRVCKPGGSVLITVPAHMHLWSEHDVVNHHYRRYDLKQIRTLFQEFSNGQPAFSSYFNYRLYPMIMMARKIGNFLGRLRKKGPPRSDFDTFKAGYLNELLYTVMAGEKKGMVRQREMKTGVSILYHWKKK